MKAKRLVLAATLAASVMGMAGAASAERSLTRVVDLGSEPRVKALFSWPNNCDASVCFIEQTLDQTVELYLKQSLERDGYTDSTVKIGRRGPAVTATIKGRAAETYPAALATFLENGTKALSAARRLNVADPVTKQKQWQYNWRFFLPFGVAMVNHPTVELLHFPPDYSLEQAQDYLNSATTNRWSHLLVQNGVPADKVDSYQAIIDINPIAAPANAGKQLESAKIEGAFDDYVTSMLRAWTAGNAAGSAPVPGLGKPMVAFGSPVRDWLTRVLGVTLAVDQATTVHIPGGSAVPVIAANHPSMIFYAAWNTTESGGRTENFKEGMSVMRQDLIAACWQARMGQAPQSNPQTVVQDCTTKWTTDTQGVCVLLETTIYNQTEDKAREICAKLPPISWREGDGVQTASLGK